MVQEDPISSKTFTFAAENFLPVSESFSHDSETLIILWLNAFLLSHHN